MYRDNAKRRKAAAPEAELGELNGFAGSRFRVAHMGKVNRGTRMIVLAGYVRGAEQQKLVPQRVRVLVDTGAEDEFITRGLAERMGARLEKGNFGVAVEAFGAETKLEHRLKNAELSFDGLNQATGLTGKFATRCNFTVVDRLNGGYDMLVGAEFLAAHRAGVIFHDTRRVCLEDDRGVRIDVPDAVEQQQLAEEGASAENDSMEARISRVAALSRTGGWREVKGVSFIKQLKTAKPASAKEQRRYLRRVNEWVRAVELNKDAEGKAEEPPDPLPQEPEARAMVEKALKEFEAVFPDALPTGLPPLRGVEPFEIKLRGDAVPCGSNGPRASFQAQELSRKECAELLEKGFIRASSSPYAAPAFYVPKPDDTMRMVIDYRALNSQTVRNRYPLPHIEGLFDKLRNAKLLSKMDLRSGYHQIRVRDEDVVKTAFVAPHGKLYEWLVMPMGLTNAPAAFMSLMQNVFRDMEEFVVVYLDDILILSNSAEEHAEHIRKVLARLQEQQLYAKKSKCQFFRKQVEFLGHVVGEGMVSMVEDKVRAVTEWEEPRTQKQVERFLGLAGYYRRFIAKFSQIAAPLSAMCGTLKAKRKGARPAKKPFVWGDAERGAFQALKTAITTAPVLALPHPELKYVVHTDASGTATGAVLMQEHPEGLRPVAFLSKSMSQAERRYAVHEQEALAILNALRAWRHYLIDKPFTVYTDHHSLQYMRTSAMATPRQVRWAATFADFDFDIRYAKGETNVAADALSRREVTNEWEEEEEEAMDAMRVQLNALARKNELPPLTVRVRDAATGDADYMARARKPVDELRAEGLVSADGLLYRESGQLVVPADKELRTYLCSAAHDTLFGAHRGGAGAVEWLKERVHWSGMDAEVKGYVAGCDMCQRNKPDNRGKQGMPQSIESAEIPWDTICIDFVGPLPRTVRGHDTIAVVVDKFSKGVVYIPMKRTMTAQEVFHLLNERVFCQYGFPRNIISDRDTRFTSRFWEALWAGMGTGLKRSTAFHPQTDGQTERANRTLIEALRSAVDATQGNWDVLLPEIQFAHNTTVSQTTGYAPFYMNHGRKARTPLDAELEVAGVAQEKKHPAATELIETLARTHKEASVAIKAAQAKQRADARPGRREGEIAVGDKVWLSNRNLREAGGDGAENRKKLGPRYYGPFVVEAMHGANAAKLALPQGWKLFPIFNLDLLKKHVDGTAAHPARPVENNMPPAVVEEDPAANGPASQMPEYEVEAIITHKYSRNKRMYLVKWLGWPREQATWQSLADLEGCMELVNEYEQRRITAIAVRATSAQQEYLTKLREHGTWIAAVQRGVKHAATEAEIAQAADRARCIAAAAETKPAAGPLPPIDKKGQRQMPSQRCVATARGGEQCRKRTLHGEFCWQHLVQQAGVRITRSTVPNAGKGLFAARDFAQGEMVARYTGDLVLNVDDEDAKQNRYLLELSRQISIDAARTNSAEGRMVNDPRGTGKRPNAQFVISRQGKTAKVVTSTNIAKGEEVLVAYGPAYWSHVRKVAAGRQSPLAERRVRFSMLTKGDGGGGKDGQEDRGRKHDRDDKGRENSASSERTKKKGKPQQREQKEREVKEPPDDTQSVAVRRERLSAQFAHIVTESQQQREEEQQRIDEIECSQLDTSTTSHASAGSTRTVQRGTRRLHLVSAEDAGSGGSSGRHRSESRAESVATDTQLEADEEEEIESLQEEVRQLQGDLNRAYRTNKEYRSEARRQQQLVAETQEMNNLLHRQLLESRQRERQLEEEIRALRGQTNQQAHFASGHVAEAGFGYSTAEAVSVGQYGAYGGGYQTMMQQQSPPTQTWRQQPSPPIQAWRQQQSPPSQRDWEMQQSTANNSAAARGSVGSSVRGFVQAVIQTGSSLANGLSGGLVGARPVPEEVERLRERHPVQAGAGIRPVDQVAQDWRDRLWLQARALSQQEQEGRIINFGSCATVTADELRAWISHRRVSRGESQDAAGNAMDDRSMALWMQEQAPECDCHWTAQRFANRTEHQPSRVMRVTGLRVGYCRRQYCECCCPTIIRTNRGVTQPYVMCGCLAVDEELGLCARCLSDTYATALRVESALQGSTGTAQEKKLQGGKL